MLPTESGHYFYEHSLDILYRLDDLKLQIKKMNQKEKTFHIGFSCGVLNIFPLEQFQKLNDEFPDIKFEWDEFENQQTLRQLKNGVLDAAFMIGTTMQEGFVCETVYQGNMTALIYPAHPYYDWNEISIKDLEHQKLISLNEKYFIYHSLNQRCQDFGFSPDIVIRTMESSLIYRFCKEKIGIGIDADIHHDAKLLEPLRKIPIKDAIAWKISFAYKESIKKDRFITQLKKFAMASTKC